MKPRLGPAFPPAFLGIPTRMSTQDWLIWVRYRPTIASAVINFYFDVGLGAGRAFPDNQDETLREMWLFQTQKRADVVAEYTDHWQIIELRDNAQANAIGRLLVYKRLWLADPPDTRPLTMTLISNNTDPDVLDQCADLGFEYATY